MRAFSTTAAPKAHETSSYNPRGVALSTDALFGDTTLRDTLKASIFCFKDRTKPGQDRTQRQDKP